MVLQKISIGIAQDGSVVRGSTLECVAPASSTKRELAKIAMEQHLLVHPQLMKSEQVDHYDLLSKDGSDLKIPRRKGAPYTPFTLEAYRDVTGIKYQQMKFYLQFTGLLACLLHWFLLWATCR